MPAALRVDAVGVTRGRAVEPAGSVHRIERGGELLVLAHASTSE